MRVLITGAAGNLGSLLARHIRDQRPDLNLILMRPPRCRRICVITTTFRSFSK